MHGVNDGAVPADRRARAAAPPAGLAEADKHTYRDPESPTRYILILYMQSCRQAAPNNDCTTATTQLGLGITFLRFATKTRVLHACMPASIHDHAFVVPLS